MDRLEKYDYAVLLLFTLIILIPIISQELLHYSIFGLSLTNLTLLTIAIVVVLGLFWLFYLSPDLGNARWKVRQLYKPTSDLDRIRDYIAEQSAQGVPPPQIIHALRVVGWNDELINNAYETMDKSKVIKLKSKRRRIKKR
ncbi:hypothetical protein HOD83_00200 [Candidatus Woesearchaeota archaeon]|jgi:hypothetical protein|nr:hypothetical protein [Candidatus Woesearchaeota archaeon]MBT4114504.1 hypothetical protein [Candidatus Woesearchaeota archaeon]MBT4248001.1 hypothetical protein [Candidatus Woesearchaeota archaeon]